MPGPKKEHPWGPAGYNLPPDKILSPELIEIIYSPHDITTTYDWILQNMPSHSILELGEGRLILGIFINAIASLKRDHSAKETWEWIMDLEADGFYSFNSVCWYLKWDPTWIRQLTIKAFGKQKPPTIHINRVQNKRASHYEAKRN